MDISMPVCNGLDATRLIKAQRPDMKIVMLTTSAEHQDLFEAIKSGACGYLLKVTTGRRLSTPCADWSRASRRFHPAWRSCCCASSPAFRDAGSGRHRNKGRGDTEKVKLTDRQTEVLRLVAAGLTYKQVGEKLCLSEATVRYHMIEVMHLLHLENRNQVIACAGELRSTGKLGLKI